MPLVEVDGLSRSEMSYTHNTLSGQTTRYFAPGRITVADASGQSLLVAGAETNGIGVALIEPRGGLSYVDTYGAFRRPLENLRFETASIADVTIGGETFLYLSSYATNDRTENSKSGLFVLQLDAGGDVDLIQFRPLEYVNDGGGTVSSLGVDPQILTVGKKTILVTTIWDRSEFSIITYRVLDDGKLRLMERSSPFEYLEEKFELIEIDGRGFLVGVGQYDQAPIQVYEIKRSGEAVLRFELSPSETAIFNRNLTDIATAEINDRTFVFVSESTSGSILVFEMNKKGELELVEQETPGMSDGWGYAEALVTFEQDGRIYIAAGGYGNGLGVLEISSGGALTEVDEYTFNDGYFYRYMYDLEAKQLGEETYLFASMALNDELRSYRFIPSDERIVGGPRRVTGTDDDDQILAGRGNDTVRAGLGDDMVEAGAGDDKVFGEAGRDNLFGGLGDDQLRGGTEDDFLFGEVGNDSIYGDEGNDYARGGEGNDRIVGGFGADRLYGDAGRDNLKGGEGTDILSDGAGRDVLSGEGGADVFVMSFDRHRDVITDFEDGIDRIDFRSAGAGTEFSDLAITQKGDNVLIAIGRDTLLVKSASDAILDYQFDRSDFIFE